MFRRRGKVNSHRQANIEQAKNRTKTTLKIHEETNNADTNTDVICGVTYFFFSLSSEEPHKKLSDCECAHTTQMSTVIFAISQSCGGGLLVF